MTTDDVMDRAREIAEVAPDLTPEQRARLRVLLAGEPDD